MNQQALITQAFAGRPVTLAGVAQSRQSASADSTEQTDRAERVRIQ
jgi:hypothetical protein